MTVLDIFGYTASLLTGLALGLTGGGGSILLFMVMVVLAIAGMSIGGTFRRRISQSKLKLGFGIFVIVMGSLILFQEFRKGIL